MLNYSALETERRMHDLLVKFNKDTSINTIKRNFKTFDDFISYHFDGLSAHTLYQSLQNTFMYKQLIQNSVYVVLYNIYTDNNITEEDINTFNTFRSLILGTELTEEDIIEIINEESFCLHFGYNANNLEWLKNNAFDWYAKHIISLVTFKRIAHL